MSCIDQGVVAGDWMLLSVQRTVRTDADFGAGYAYPVLVEGAKLRK